jgi:nucleoside-diphosphate-sugar epimerase
MKILLTGGNGFIGSHLYKYLTCTREHEVYRTTFDITDYHHVKWSVADFNPQVIFHLAANPNTKRDEDNPTKITLQNVLGTHNMLEAAPKCCRFVFISSCAVYGDYPCSLSMNEAPSSVYGLTKLAGEQYVNLYQDKLNTLIIRLAANVGRGAKHGLLPDLFRKFREPVANRYMVFDYAKTFPINKGIVRLLGAAPGSIKPFTYVGDTVEFIRKVGLDLSARPNYPLIVSNKDSISVLEVANIVKKYLFSTKEIEWTGESWPGDNQRVDIGNHIGANHYGWKPVYDTSEKAVIRACEDFK